MYLVDQYLKMAMLIELIEVDIVMEWIELKTLINFELIFLGLGRDLRGFY
jgi:hypothetical protein